ncbi:programmed cell death 6-interacting protein-like [Pectinophora gossypiella]|uniref:programmed cell death 6-interacting protein-like n=1 Tax=Pectinophora gossypiella TaxID=13191 RepID=UPI00214F25A3|nr:programmed cell death 6-interacting protein-like [Pectinophora gossypiella]XP_049887092.1 programmed cell death 6-interacting protein-like [Pectinophora gossypiella]
MAPCSKKDLEQKLKQALLELQASQEECKKLLEEHEESEAEVINVNNRILSLKNELTELDGRYKDLQHQRDYLQSVINSQDECRNNHEAALNRIRELEQQVAIAYNTIKAHEDEHSINESQQTMALYNELVRGENCQNNESMTIDLTSMSDKYSDDDEGCEETHKLRQENCELQRQLARLQQLYGNAQKEITEHIKATESLVINTERLESLVHDRNLELETLRAKTSSESSEDLQRGGLVVISGASPSTSAACTTLRETAPRVMCDTAPPNNEPPCAALPSVAPAGDVPPGAEPRRVRVRGASRRGASAAVPPSAAQAPAAPPPAAPPGGALRGPGKDKSVPSV